MSVKCETNAENYYRRRERERGKMNGEKEEGEGRERGKEGETGREGERTRRGWRELKRGVYLHILIDPHITQNIQY